MARGDEVGPSGPDDELEESLSGLWRRAPAPPPKLLYEAGQLFALRGVDAEYAALIADSESDVRLPQVAHAERAGIPVKRAAETPVRHSGARGRRRLAFEARSLSVLVDVLETGSAVRLRGSIAPAGAARLEVHRPGPQPAVVVDADSRGGFLIDGLARGPARLVCRRGGEPPVALQWVML